MYDIFYVSKNSIDEKEWKSFKSKYPTSQKLENITTFEQIQKKAFTKMFWVVWDHLTLTDFKFDYKVSEWDEDYIHVFKNGNYYDGICIFPKNAQILQREWNYRFFTNKKEINIVASQPNPTDIVFISYNETFADDNFQNICKREPTRKIYRINGVKGIHQAHIEAAKLVTTDMFYVVDADAHILNEFKFDYQIPYYDFNAKGTVHVWKSQNPVNGLEYGYGGVKLLPRELTINMDLSKPDMTTSISKWFKPMPAVSNITAFNTDPFNSWKSAFRECCKLASRSIDRQDDKETQDRLDVWCTLTTDIHALSGARAGRAYGENNSNNSDALQKINDFNWLEEQWTNNKS
jgi:hypothetical protein